MQPKTFVAACTVIAGIALSSGCGGSEPHAVASDEPLPPVSAPAAVIDSRPNAATQYREIHARMGTGFFGPLANVDAQSLTQAECAFLASKQSLVLDLIAVSKIERCDFGTDVSEGVNTLLPHLAWMRHFSQLLHYDARRFLQSPSGQRGAAERLAAIIRISQHAATEPLLLSKLVGMACLGLACDRISSSRDRLLTDPQAKALLAAELSNAKQSAVFDMRGVFEAEFDMIRTSIERGQDYSNNFGKVTIAEHERAAVLAELNRCYTAIEAAWDQPGRERRLNEIVESVRVPTAKVFVAPFAAFAKQIGRIERTVDSAVSATK